jgi:hypothetical protein
LLNLHGTPHFLYGLLLVEQGQSGYAWQLNGLSPGVHVEEVFMDKNQEMSLSSSTPPKIVSLNWLWAIHCQTDRQG